MSTLKQKVECFAVLYALRCARKAKEDLASEIEKLQLRLAGFDKLISDKLEQADAFIKTMPTEFQVAIKDPKYSFLTEPHSHPKDYSVNYRFGIPIPEEFIANDTLNISISTDPWDLL